MHGSLRFCLSTLVVLSHLGRPGVVNVGVCAVVIFYLLAGYVVTHLLQKHFASKPLRLFYAERFLRIYPLYFLFLLITSIFLYTTQYKNPAFDPFKVVANLTIVPLNYYMLLPEPLAQEFLIMPPTWSLGAELQAYAILPFILRSTVLKWAVGLLSLCVFSASATGILHPDIWGYRLLPGTIFIFLAGSAVYKKIKFKEGCDRFDLAFPTIAWGWLLILLLPLTISYRIHPYSAAVMLGFLIGIPILLFTSEHRFRIPFDKILGQLSYGLFLIHLPVAWFYEHFFSGVAGSKTGFLVVMAASIILSAIGTITVERLIWPLRRSITTS